MLPLSYLTPVHLSSYICLGSLYFTRYQSQVWHMSMTYSTSSSPTQTIVSNLLTLSEINLPNYNFPFKLEVDNYVIWKSQIHSVIVGCNMENFINRSIQPPSSTITEITTADGSTCQWVDSNLEYQRWRRFDQAFLVWILSSVSKEIHTLISKVSMTFTSHQLWSSLEW